MGSKGSNTVQQTQSYSPNPAIAAAGTQALTGAQTAAQAPFQMPVAPVAGFNADQLAAFGATNAAQGMAQPYINQGANYLNQSAQPISAQQVANYYNPMAANVTAQMQNIFGEQQAQNTGSLTQTAGGVGSDRIAVGQADLANQQSLAAGQTYSGLYQQALQAAQGQQQMEAGAGYGLGQLGPAAENAQLQGISAQLGTGGLQQQLAQAQLNAPYQQQLAQIAYPFQTSQYLAGVTGSLAPALGGTSQGSVTYPSPSALAQALGVGTSALGALGSAGGTAGLKGGLNTGTTALASGMTTGDLAALTGESPDVAAAAMAALPFGARRGGRIHYDTGGSTYGNLDDKLRLQALGGAYPAAQAGNPLAQEVVGDLPTYDDGGQVPMGMPMGAPMGGVPNMPMTNAMGLPFPGASAPTGSPVPQMQLQGGQGGRSMLPYGQGMFMSMQKPGSQGTPSGTSNTSAEMNAAMQILPMMAGMKRGGMPHDALGGAVDSTHIGEGFDDGGNTGDDELATLAAQAPDNSPPPGAWDPNTKRGFNPNNPNAGPVSVSGDPSAINTLTAEANATPPPPMADPGAVPYPTITGQTPGPSAPMRVAPRPVSAPPQAQAQAPMTTPMQMPQAQQPYPDALNRDWGQEADRSPWMALVKAGAAMATSPGPIGSVIGRGIQAGAGELDTQRKQLQSEEDINQKAQQLYNQAQQHLDEYNKMTPYQKQELGLREQALNMRRQAVTGLSGSVVNQIAKSVYGDPIWQSRTQEEQDAEIDRRISMERSKAGPGGGSAAPPAGGGQAGLSPGSALPDPGDGNRVRGMYYQTPQGVRQWNGI